MKENRNFSDFKGNSRYLLTYDFKTEVYQIFSRDIPGVISNKDLFQLILEAREKGFLPQSQINKDEVSVILRDGGRNIEGHLARCPFFASETYESPIKESFVFMYNGYISTERLEEYQGFHLEPKYLT